MARIFSPVVPPSDPRQCAPWLNKELRRISIALQQQGRGLSAIARGEVPDGSGTPLVDLSGVFLLAGRVGNQLGAGGTQASGTLTLTSTSSSTKGFIYLGISSAANGRVAFDETNDYFGIGTDSPAARLHLNVPTPAQHLRPSSFGVNGANSGWVDQLGSGVTADVIAAVNEVSPDDTTYVVHQMNNGLCKLHIDSGTDPGTRTGHVMRFRAKASDIGVGGKLRCGLAQGTNTIKEIVIGTDATTPTVTELSTAFTTYAFTIDAADAASITDYTDLYLYWLNGQGVDASKFIYVSWAELQLPGSAAVTLQRWSQNTTDYVNDLAFALDGGSSADLTLTGTPALRINAGGGTSGLRLLTSSTNGRLEVGTASATNMNLVLSGTRATQGTLLISDFLNSRFTGTIEIRGGSPASGRILTSTNSNGLATWTSAAALATREVTRWVVNGFYFVDTNWDGAYIVPTAMTISSIVLWRRVAGSSGTTEIDILKNGVSIFSAKPSVTSASGSNATASGTLNAGATCVAGDRLTLDITQAEVDGEDLSVTMEGA